VVDAAVEEEKEKDEKNCSGISDRTLNLK